MLDPKSIIVVVLVVIVETEVVKYGDDLAIIIPKPMLKKLGWSIGTELSFEVGKDSEILILREVKDRNSKK